MERLTESRKYYDCEFMEDGIAPYMNKLAAYEDAEEQDRLVVLPKDTEERIDKLEDLLRLSKLCLARKKKTL